MAQNIFDTLVQYSIDRFYFARQAYLRAFSQSRLPAYLSDDGSFDTDYFGISADKARAQRVATTVSWIYSDIHLLAKEVSAAGIKLKKRKGEDLEDVKNHPIEQRLMNPNSEMTGSWLLQYTMWWLQLSGSAFWYLAPDVNTGEVSEIWPMQADRVKPVPGKDRFIEKYLYYPKKGMRPIRIDPEYVIFFRYPNPFDMWSGLAPLTAGFLPIEVDQAEARWQRDTFVSGKGIPHSIVLLDPKMSDREFTVAAARIREDFQEGRKVAIARAGDMKVATVGITPQQLSLIESRTFTRDELDIIFLGVAFHSIQSETGFAAVDKIFKEKTVHPIHIMLAGQLTTQFVQPRIGDDYFIEFDDVRPQDRSLEVQEFNIYKAVLTLDEARSKRDAKEFDDSKLPTKLPGLGSLPVLLATNPQFVLAYYKLNAPKPQPLEKKEKGNASLPESDAEGNISDREGARGNDETPKTEDSITKETRASEKSLKHLGPGPHPNGTPQSIHGRGSNAAGVKIRGRKLDPKDRVYQPGKEVPGYRPLGKQSRAAVGAQGERIARVVLEKMKGEKFDHLSTVVENSPLDLVGNHSAVEVKTGMVTVTKSHRHWRITLGEPSPGEKAAIKQMTPAEKSFYNRAKMDWAVQRKLELTRQLSRKLGRRLKPVTVGVIMAPSGRSDVFIIPGFHKYLGWHKYATDKYYVGTFLPEVISNVSGY